MGNSSSRAKRETRQTRKNRKTALESELNRGRVEVSRATAAILSHQNKGTGSLEVSTLTAERTQAAIMASAAASSQLGRQTAPLNKRDLARTWWLLANAYSEGAGCSEMEAESLQSCTELHGMIRLLIWTPGSLMVRSDGATAPPVSVAVIEN